MGSGRKGRTFFVKLLLQCIIHDTVYVIYVYIYVPTPHLAKSARVGKGNYAGGHYFLLHT